MDAKALFEAPYLDYLQAPLQPLMDNLESQTYETFEQDNFKYDQYEKAITRALLATPEEKESVVMVVGAGRGPLVRCALRASATAQRHTRLGGVSIPCKYTSYVAPIMSSKLWNDVKALDGLKHFETPYVFGTRIDNRRQQDMVFQAEADAVVHGFAGYFDAVLYDDVTLSIHPETHSDGMFSWFPIYFPLRQPVGVEQGNSMRVSFWRMVGGSKVWYE
ncbi:hypothetical protein PINS_up005495 [Pythium insidiosum]|nr:hypothetical protein PINS_up005495 [Pythium insidiosum]